jgi:hypothetical protein
VIRTVCGQCGQRERVASAGELPVIGAGNGQCGRVIDMPGDRWRCPGQPADEAVSREGETLRAMPTIYWPSIRVIFGEAECDSSAEMPRRDLN